MEWNRWWWHTERKARTKKKLRQQERKLVGAMFFSSSSILARGQMSVDKTLKKKSKLLLSVEGCCGWPHVANNGQKVDRKRSFRSTQGHLKCALIEWRALKVKAYVATAAGLPLSHTLVLALPFFFSLRWHSLNWVALPAALPSWGYTVVHLRKVAFKPLNGDFGGIVFFRITPSVSTRRYIVIDIEVIAFIFIILITVRVLPPRMLQLIVKIAIPSPTIKFPKEIFLSSPPLPSATTLLCPLFGAGFFFVVVAAAAAAVAAVECVTGRSLVPEPMRIVVLADWMALAVHSGDFFFVGARRAVTVSQSLAAISGFCVLNFVDAWLIFVRFRPSLTGFAGFSL